MGIPESLLTLTKRLSQDLEETQQEATEGLNLVRQMLSLFPDDQILTQFLAYFNTVLFFIVDSKEKQIGELVMNRKSLSEQQQVELAEILEILKVTEQKARELHQGAIAFEAKWKHRLKGRDGITPQSSEIL